MFGLGFSEIMVICAIALLVLGPKNLPKATRTLGRTLAELRRTVDDIKKEVYLPEPDDKPESNKHKES